jgi:lysyl-tRNA synthetase class 2
MADRFISAGASNRKPPGAPAESPGVSRGIDDWKPSASIRNLGVRARLYAQIRDFFASRGVVEVETPSLSAATVTDPHLHSMSCIYTGPNAPQGRKLYLQTSPEFAMKRLLAAGSGPIYQICKAFRDNEEGRHHNPEFTLLEWYRPGFDHHALMKEVDELLSALIGAPPADRASYRAVFAQQVGLDPLSSSLDELAQRARDLGSEEMPSSGIGRDGLLHLLMSHHVAPHLGRDRPCFVYDYPRSQAALARLRPDEPTLAERFELYIDGLELGNGFHELTDAEELRRRFQADSEERRAAGLPLVAPDERLLEALSSGLPACAGVALGVDRLIMLVQGEETLSKVIAFPLDRA